VRPTGRAAWQAFGSLVQQARQRVWWPHARLTAKFDYRVNLLALWEAGEREPWLLSTNLATPGETVRAYRRRMWTEELFGDLKGHGFDLASTHLNQFERLSRLTLWVTLVYVWLLLMGARAI
jgi:DDE family transposase